MIKIKSIKTKTMLSILPITIVLLLSLTSISYVLSKNSLTKEINEKMNYKLNELSLGIENKLVAHKRVAETLARTVEASTSTLSKDEYRKLLEKFAVVNGDTFGAGIWFEAYKYKADIKNFGPYAYKDGDKVSYTEDYSTDSYNYQGQDWYKNAQNTKNTVAWSKPYYDDISKTTMVTASAPFYDNSNNFLGATATDINLTSLQNIITDLKFGESGSGDSRPGAASLGLRRGRQ